MAHNIDLKVVEGFGDEWSRFDQSHLTEGDRLEMFEGYFAIFPWHLLPEGCVGFDLGCGSGRWARLVAPRVGKLYCIDPSAAALSIAQKNLENNDNCTFHVAGVDNIPLADASADFGYSLGVLHHIPDTVAGIKACAAKLKPGAPFLLYLYFAFDNKPSWYRLLWRMSNLARVQISIAPYPLRYVISQAIACLIYFPLARLARVLELLGLNVDSVPLAYYRKLSFYVMRTDALDRFGTRLEKRFTRKEIVSMMQTAGLEKISFGEARPYWVALGYKQ